MDPRSGTITITFGDQAENHVGMQKIGALSHPAGAAVAGVGTSQGFTLDTLAEAQAHFSALGCDCQWVPLNAALPDDVEAPTAAVLIVRRALPHLCTGQDTFAGLADPLAAILRPPVTLFSELAALPWDTQALMYGRVVIKHARYNLTFDTQPQEPDYAAGKGRIISYASLPLLNQVRSHLPTFLGPTGTDLVAEGNYYYDASTCGIGFHGDGERKKVLALRLGQSMPLHYQWYQQGQPIGDRVRLSLNDGDLYIMSEMATGWNWKTRSVPTLRHAAGAAKFLLDTPEPVPALAPVEDCLYLDVE